MLVIKGIWTEDWGYPDMDFIVSNLERCGLRPLFRLMAETAEWATGLDYWTLSWGYKGKADLVFAGTIRDPFEDDCTGEIFFNNNVALVIHSTLRGAFCLGVAHYKHGRRLNRLLRQCVTVAEQLTDKRVKWRPFELELNRFETSRGGDVAGFPSARKIPPCQKKVRFRHYEMVAANVLAIPEIRKALIDIRKNSTGTLLDESLLSRLTGAALLRRNVPTSLGNMLCDNSHWMRLWLTGLLIEGGARRKSIQWEVGNKGDEVDIMLDVYGIRTLFELKDGNFEQGHLYQFLGRMDNYRGDLAVIVTTGRMNESLKSIARDKLGEHFEVWEGKNTIEKAALTYPARASIEAACECVKMYPPCRYLDISGVIRKWASRVAKQTPH